MNDQDELPEWKVTALAQLEAASQAAREQIMLDDRDIIAKTYGEIDIWTVEDIPYGQKLSKIFIPI